MFFRSALNFYVALFANFILVWNISAADRLYIVESDFSDNKSDTIPKVVVDSLGRLGLGVENPQEKLDISGNIRFSGHLLPNGIIGDSGAVMISRGPLLPPVWDSNFRQGVWEDLADRILFNQKNIEIGKTLVNVGDYSLEPGQHYFNLWKPNINTTPDLPPFTFTGGEFPNPLPDQPNNYVYNFGSNINTGGGILENGKPAYGLGFENRFYIDSMPYNEFHILAIDQNGIQRRPLTNIYAFDGSRNDWTNFVSSMKLQDKDGTKEIYNINTETESWNYNGNALRHIFNTPNYQPIWQNIGNGTVFPLIGYLPGRLQLGNSTGLTTIRIGQGFELGNDGDCDYIGTALGDGATNLSFGSSGKRYNTILFKTNFTIVSRFTNTNNNNGWGIGLDASGNMYFNDYSSETIPFSLGANMPNNSFNMFSNGNLCLGGTDQSQRLSVIGNLKIAGAFMPNSLSGNVDEVLVSQGPSSAPKWELRISGRYEEAFVATFGQTEFVISTNIDAPSNNKIPVEVYKNGIKLKYKFGTPGIREFNYNANTIILDSCVENDEVEVVYFR